MWTRFYTKITSSPRFKYFKRYCNSLLGRVEKITPLEVYVVILVVAGVTFANRYFRQEAIARFVRVEVTTREWKNSEGQYDYKVPYWLSDKLAVGQTQRSLSGRIKAEIVDIENYARGNDQAQIYLVMKLMADYNPKTQEYSFQGQQLLVGSPLELELDGVSVPGQIIDNNYPPAGYEEGEFKVTLKNRYVEPWLVKGLKTGAQMRNRANGQVVAKLLNFTDTESQTQQITSLDGDLIINHEPRRDVISQFQIKAVKQDGSWFFAGQQRVRLGAELWIYLEDIILSRSEIIKLEYVE